MALPAQLDSTTPPGSQSPSLGDDRIRELKLAIIDILGIVDATNVATAAASITANGLDQLIMYNAAANASAAGRIRRNATNLTFHDGTSSQTVAFINRPGGSESTQQVFAPGTQSGTTSVQALAGDLTVAAGYGSSTATAPVYAAGVMGNLISTTNMTATQNILGGVIGKYDLTGTNSSVMPKAAVIAELGDTSTTANGAVMAVIGGDSGVTTAQSAYGVMSLNSAFGSYFDIGLDLYRAAVGSYLAVRYNTAAIRVPNNTWIMSRNAAGTGNTNLISLNASDVITLGSALTVANGGTGAATFTSNGVMYGNGTSALQVTAQGGTNTILVANAGAPAWSATPTIETSLQLGRASTTTGELILGHASSANLTRLRAGNATEANTYIWPVDGGAANQVLTSDGATPTTVLSWTTPSAGVTISGTPADNQVGVWTSATALEGAANLIFDGNKLFVGDTTHVNLTQGLCVNQGAADDIALAVKSSDIAHGLTSAFISCETDDYFIVQKYNGTDGAGQFVMIAEDPIAAQSAGSFDVLGGQPATTPSTTSEPICLFRAIEHNGANALANAAANAVIYAFARRTAGSTQHAFIIDAEGDLFVDGSTTLTAFDEWDDIALVRAFDATRTPDRLIRSKWDEFVHYGKAELVRAGILSDVPEGTMVPSDIPCEREKGIMCHSRPMVNITQLQRLHNGAIWQLSTQVRELREQLSIAQRQIAALGA